MKVIPLCQDELGAFNISNKDEKNNKFNKNHYLINRNIST